MTAFLERVANLGIARGPEDAEFPELWSDLRGLWFPGHHGGKTVINYASRGYGNGSLGAGQTAVMANHGYRLSCTASNAGVSVGSDPQLDNIGAMTLLAHVNYVYDTTTTGAAIFSKSTWFLRLEETANNWRMFFFDDGTAGDVTIRSNVDSAGDQFCDQDVWLGCTWDGNGSGGNADLWRNGVELTLATETYAGTPKSDAANNLTFGGNGDSASAGGNFMIWSRRLPGDVLHRLSNDPLYHPLTRRPVKRYYPVVAAAGTTAPNRLLLMGVS